MMEEFRERQGLKVNQKERLVALCSWQLSNHIETVDDRNEGGVSSDLVRGRYMLAKNCS